MSLRRVKYGDHPGMKKHGKLMVFCIKSYWRYTDGYKFFKSKKNGVYLTDFVPVEYLS